jgi:hypothetical protein
MSVYLDSFWFGSGMTPEGLLNKAERKIVQGNREM